MHDLTSSVYSEIIAGAHEAATEFGKTVLVGEANEAASGRTHLEELIAGRGVDGVILQGAGTTFDRTLVRAARHGVPAVMLQAGDPQKNLVVKLDDEAGAQTATEHLLSLGHRKVGFVGISSELDFSKDREAGWRNALNASGVTADDTWSVDGGNKFESGAVAIAQLLRRHPNMTAAVIANMASAIGVLAALADHGRSVPSDFSLIAIHEIPLAQYLRPAMTVVQITLRDLGSEAIRQVTSKDFGTGAVCVSKVQPKLIVRNTTARLGEAIGLEKTRK